MVTASLRTINYTPKALTIAWPANVDAAVGSTDTGIVAQSSDNQKPRSVASVAKVITALAVITKRPFTGVGENVITFTANDEALYAYYVSANGSNIPIKAGDQLSEYQALEAMLLPSANNMADSLAIWAFGSMEAYTSYANEMVKGFGLTKTTVGEPSGFDDTVLSTPGELVILGKKLFANKTLAQIVGLQSDDLPNVGKIFNTNQLLGRGAQGIKTGHTNIAGYCLLLEKTLEIDKKHSVHVITAVLGANSAAESFNISEGLMASAQSNIGSSVVAKKDTVIGTYKTPWGSRSEIVTENDVLAYGWKSSRHVAEINTSILALPASAGTQVGRISTLDSNKDLEISNLYLKTTLRNPSAWWRLTHYF